MKEEKKQDNNYLSLSLKLMMIVAVVVFILSLVNLLTADVIAKKELQVEETARKTLIPEAVNFKKMDLTLSQEEAKLITAVYLATGSDGFVYGYCINVSPSGFSGQINLIIAVSTNPDILGIKTISHSETPNIGSSVLEDNGGLIPQYRNMNLQNVNNIQAISGATTTSKAVNSGAKAALLLVTRIIQETGGGY